MWETKSMREEKDMENKTEAQCLYELAMKHIYGDGVPEDMNWL